MKIAGIVLGFLLGIGGGTSRAFAVEYASDIQECFKEGRNTELCLEMRHMRNGLHLFDTQRELMQIDFSYIACVADDLDVLLARIERTASNHSHLQPVRDLHAMVRLVKRQASENNIEVLRMTNRLQNQCQRCHTADPLENPPADWSTITQFNWKKITERCNGPNHNPFVCKNMYGMMAQVQFLESASHVGGERYESIAAAAGEIHRIASLIITYGGVHGGITEPLRRLASEAATIQELAQRKIREVFLRASRISNSCRVCHGSDPNRGEP